MMANPSRRLATNRIARLTRKIEYKYLVGVAFVLALFMDIMDATVVNVALPRLGQEFRATTSTREWVVSGHLLGLALRTPTSGWLGDRFGTRRVFLVSLGIFLAGSALCGAAWSVESLATFRVLQGIGGGMMVPMGSAPIGHSDPLALQTGLMAFHNAAAAAALIALVGVAFAVRLRDDQVHVAPSTDLTAEALAIAADQLLAAAPLRAGPSARVQRSRRFES